ncbi:amino acid adenylation domain-containing protein [Fodinibius sp. SL11]|uniref:amino acid adenylation domain-containing protein n=1 Tax=Fodinibius sp. SL11 TaxID=3425690 RepID=UPI003F885727
METDAFEQKKHQRDELFFETVTAWLNHGFEHHPNSVAVTFGQQIITYGELNSLSNKIASYLITEGIKHGDRVGICLERSPEMIACIVGILKSGAAYVPLDANYPVERLSIMSEDARLSLLIMHQKFGDRFKKKVRPTVQWENIQQKIENQPTFVETPEIKGEDVAYVIFTSGSTGRPKGIEMPHRALANLITWQLERSYFKPAAKVLQYSSISFDVSFQEIATTLASGGMLVLLKDSDRRDPRILLDVLNNYGIDRLFIPFVALRSLIEVANTSNKYPASLIEVITAGEQLRVDSGVRSFFQKIPRAILENQYGPSETHVISAYLLDKDPLSWPDLPPIGKPVKNNSIYVLDENMEPVPQGQQGELYLAGKNLAHGYIGRDDLTAKAFIEMPLDRKDAPVLYKTGDLGFYNAEGNIEFLGRADHQIKIRGYRVEPGEIDTIGASYPGVSQCITHAFQNKKNHSQLVTYYLPQNGNQINGKDFKGHLAHQLPEYMIPSFVVELSEIPYTPSGKIDLKSLPDPGFLDEKELVEVVYETETEARLAQIWKQLLGVENIPRQADFFELGGDSLNAVTLFLKIDEQFGKDLPLSTLAQASTLAGLAKIITDTEVKDYNRKFRSLQTIQKGSNEKVPLFMVHGGAGNVLMFFELAQSFPSDQPVYGFQWPGWDGFKGIDDIVEMAKFYKDELKQVQPIGPYRLGGYCIGGIIAIEIAELLKNEGEEVIDPILVVDAPNIYSKHFHSGYPEFSQENQEAFERLRLKMADQLPVKSTVEQSKSKNRDKKTKDPSKRRYPLLAKYLPFYLKLGRWYLIVEKFVKDKMQLLRIWSRTKLSLKISVNDRRRYCQLTQIAAVKRHKKRIYKGDILYLKSKALHGQNLSIEGWWSDLFFGFEELCSGRFEAHVVDKGHNDVLKSPIAHQIIKDKMLKINE